MANQKLTIRSGDTSYAVEVLTGLDEATLGRVAVEGESEPLQIERLQPGGYRVTHGDRGWSVFVAGTPEACWVFIDGQVYTLEVTSGGGRRRSAVGAHEALSAPMPATVVKVLVEPGQTVKKGDTLIVLEAMKMELPVRAPGDGIIAAIDCREGDLVQPGAPLLEFA
ncbi:MAG TPA: biotin/lipoyl-containing protein [Vicinamibacterales bacterium]|nr:biotin/lipoyl-containing protein [Vicinamibacterales bacterium]